MLTPSSPPSVSLHPPALTRWEVKNNKAPEGTSSWFTRCISANEKQTGWAGPAWASNSCWERRQLIMRGFSCCPIYFRSLSDKHTHTYSIHISVIPPSLIPPPVSLTFPAVSQFQRMNFKYKILLSNKFLLSEGQAGWPAANTSEWHHLSPHTCTCSCLNAPCQLLTVCCLFLDVEIMDCQHATMSVLTGWCLAALFTRFTSLLPC